MQLKYMKSVNEITHTHTHYTIKFCSDEKKRDTEDVLLYDFNSISLELMQYKV